MMALTRPERVEQKVEVIGAGQRAILKRSGARPPDDVPLAVVVFDHCRLPGAAVLNAVSGIAHLPCGLRHHPHLAGIGERVEAFGFETAGSKVEFLRCIGLAAGKNRSAPVASRKHAATSLQNVAYGLDIIAFACK